MSLMAGGLLGIGILAGAGLAARFTFWRPNIEGVPILMYHYLTDDLTGTRLPKLRVRPAAFEKQLDYLVKHGYQTIGFNDYRRHLETGRPLPPRPVIITFDDGEREALEQARKTLADRGFMAVVFVVSDLVGKTNVWDRSKGEPELALMDWDGLKSLVEDGWEIGSHTRTHADLSRLDGDALVEELTGAKQAIEVHLGREVIALAYPYGGVNGAVGQAARRAGYHFGITTRHGKNRPQDDPFDLKRIIIKRKDTLWDLALKLKKGRSTL